MMRQQAMTQRQQRKYRRLGLLIAAPVVVVGLVAVMVLTRQPGYSGFDVIGKRPAVVQVFLPG
jgi:hypothetical protein